MGRKCKLNRSFALPLRRTAPAFQSRSKHCGDCSSTSERSSSRGSPRTKTTTTILSYHYQSKPEQQWRQQTKSFTLNNHGNEMPFKITLCCQFCGACLLNVPTQLRQMNLIPRFAKLTGFVSSYSQSCHPPSSVATSTHRDW